MNKLGSKSIGQLCEETLKKDNSMENPTSIFANIKYGTRSADFLQYEPT